MYDLYDPEVASEARQYDDGEYYFCAGNITFIAISVFKMEHKCNQYCKIVTR